MTSPARGRPLSPATLFVICLLVFLVALTIRVVYALSIPIPVSADAAYYVMVAENLCQGRGFVSDYVWNYLAGVPSHLPVPSNEYWMPGQSLVISASFLLSGSTSLRAAQAPSLVLGALLCALTAWIAGALFRRRDAAIAAGAMAAVSFQLAGAALHPDHFGLAACLVNLSLLALWAGRRGSPLLALVGGAAAGLAYLTRTDGAMLGVVAALLGAALFRQGQRRRAALYLLCFTAAAVLVVAPWWARQLSVFGHLGGAGPLRTAFLTDYNDLFRVDQADLNLRDYLATNQVVALGFKGFVLGKQLRLLGGAVGVAGVLMLLALADRELRRRASPWLIYLALGLLVPALVFPYPAIKGGFWHLMPGLCPVIFALGAGKAVQLATRPGRPGGAMARLGAWSGLVLAFAWLLPWWAAVPREARSAQRPLYPALNPALVRAVQEASPVVLTDSAWGLYHVTRLPCAQFPSDGAEAALVVAEALEAGYLITRADAPNRIPRIAEVVGHPRFQPFARHEGKEGTLLVYRLLPSTVQPDQSPSDSRLRMSQ